MQFRKHQRLIFPILHASGAACAKTENNGPEVSEIAYASNIGSFLRKVEASRTGRHVNSVP